MTARVEALTVRGKGALAAIVAGAFALRVAYILSRRGDILFDFPVVDEESYVQVGRSLANGVLPNHLAWWQPPGLACALAAVFRVAGQGLMAPRIVQALVSSAGVLLAFEVARRLFTKPVAFATAVVCSLHGVLVFESYELLPPTWIMTADLGAVLLLLITGERRTSTLALLSGLAFGVSAVFSPTIVPFVLVAAAYLKDRTLVLALALGVALPIAPVTSMNWARDHEIVAVSTNGGVNFYIGNNTNYDATLQLRPGRHWEELMDEPTRAGAVTPAAASAYFFHRGLAFYGAHPGEAALLFARKLYLYFDGAEVPRDTDIYAAREGSPLLAPLVWRGPPFFPDGILVPLGLAGCVVCWRDRRKLAVVYALLAFLAVVTAAFFVTSRYRVPALPFLAMFAAAAVQSAASRRAAALPFALLVVPLNVPLRETKTSYAAELEFYRGLAYERHLNDPRAACDHFRRATDENPSDERSWFELGNALDASREGDPVDAWRHAATIDPWDSRPRRRMAAALQQRGDLDGAIETLEANISAHQRDEAHYAPDHLNLAFLLARRGRWDEAVAELRATAVADRSYLGGNITGFARAARSAGLDDARFVAALDELAGDGRRPR